MSGPLRLTVDFGLSHQLEPGTIRSFALSVGKILPGRRVKVAVVAKAGVLDGHRPMLPGRYLRVQRRADRCCTIGGTEAAPAVPVRKVGAAVWPDARVFFLLHGEVELTGTIRPDVGDGPLLAHGHRHLLLRIDGGLRIGGGGFDGIGQEKRERPAADPDVRLVLDGHLQKIDSGQVHMPENLRFDYPDLDRRRLRYDGAEDSHVLVVWQRDARQLLALEVVAVGEDVGGSGRQVALLVDAFRLGLDEEFTRIRLGHAGVPVVGPVGERLGPCLGGSIGKRQRDLLRQLVAVGCGSRQIEKVVLSRMHPIGVVAGIDHVHRDRLARCLDEVRRII